MWRGVRVTLSPRTGQCWWRPRHTAVWVPDKEHSHRRSTRCPRASSNGLGFSVSVTCFPRPFSLTPKRSAGHHNQRHFAELKPRSPRSTTRSFNAKNSPCKQALMTPHSQDVRGLRFRSTFSGAPLISFRQHHPCGAGPRAAGAGRLG